MTDAIDDAARRAAILERRVQRQQSSRPLRTIRRERDMTQVELAALSGVGQTTISEIERGRHDPRWHTLARLAHALDVDPHVIIPFDDGQSVA